MVRGSLKRLGDRLMTSAGMHISDPRATLAYLVSELARRFPTLAYIHVVKPLAEGPADRVALPGETCSGVCQHAVIRLMHAQRKVFTHGDLHQSNIMMNDNVVTGVIDWGVGGVDPGVTTRSVSIKP